MIANAAIANTASAVDKFEGDGNTTAFTLSYTYTGNTDALVFVNGALRNPGDDYTLSGTTITFVTAPSLRQLLVTRMLLSGERLLLLRLQKQLRSLHRQMHKHLETQRKTGPVKLMAMLTVAASIRLRLMR